MFDKSDYLSFIPVVVAALVLYLVERIKGILNG
jgi:hypothetical protein